MAIALSCACGRDFRIKDELAGKKVKCPECSTVLVVPKPSAQIEEEDAFEVLSAESEPETQHKGRRDRESSIAAPEQPRPRPAPAQPPKRSRPRDDSPPQRTSCIAFEPGWFGSTNSGVVGGVLMMVIAAVWFFVGRAADRIFIYPPILFCIGIISMVKGFTGGGD